MSDLRKAAEMALEALEWNYGTDLCDIENCTAWLDKMNATIPALRQALEEPDQDREWTDEEIDAHSRKMLIDLKKQMKRTDEEAVVRAIENMKREGWFDPPKQEPVDWEAVAADQAMTIAMMKTEKREWVGLTTEETADLYDGLYSKNQTVLEIIRCVEARLKEKNT